MQCDGPGRGPNHTVLALNANKDIQVTYIHIQTNTHWHPDMLQSVWTLRKRTGHTDSNCWQALVTDKDSQRALEGHILLFVPAFVAVGAVGGWDRVDRGALFAGGMGRMWGVGEAGPRLAGVVVKLHQAEDQVRGHQLKRVRRIGYDIPGGEGEQMQRGPGSKFSPELRWVFWDFCKDTWALTVWYTGFGCWDVRPASDRCQSTACCRFSGLCRTSRRNNRHPAK